MIKIKTRLGKLFTSNMKPLELVIIIVVFSKIHELHQCWDQTRPI